MRECHVLRIQLTDLCVVCHRTVTTLNVSNNDLRIGVEQPEEIMDTELDVVELFQGLQSGEKVFAECMPQIDWQSGITFVAALAGALQINK